MTDAAAAPATEQQAPVLYHNSQPISPEGAASLRETLTSNKDYMKAWADGDRAKVKELSDLRQLANGVQPATEEGAPLSPPQTEGDVFARADTREAREQAMRAETLAGEGFTPAQIHQILGGRPITLEERQIHERQITRLKTDRAFMQRWYNGERAALDEMALHVAARGMPIGTLAQVEAWDRANPMKQT